MAYKGQRAKRNPIILDPAAQSQDRVYTRLLNGVQTLIVDVIIRAPLTFAGGAAGTIRNRGSLFAAVKEMGLDENGTERQRVDARVFRFLSEVASPNKLSAKRLTAVADGVVQLEEAARFIFAHPFQLKGSETAFMERNPSQLVQIFAQLHENAVARLVKMEAGTATLGQVSISVRQKFDRFSGERPAFIPTIRDATEPIKGDGDFEIYLKPRAAVRQLVISQDSSVGEVPDIVETLAVRSDARDIIGPEPVPFQDLCMEMQQEYGGHAYKGDGTDAHLVINFAEGGRLGKALEPAQDPNVRLIGRAKPTAVAGAADSRIRYTYVELERTPGVVSTEVPFASAS